MRLRAGRVRRATAALGVVLLVTLAVVGGLAGPATAADGGDGELPVAVRITGVTPQVLRPGEELTVRVELRNTGTVPVAEPTVALHLDTGSFISRSSLDRWRTATPRGRTGAVRVQDESAVPLAPGAARTVTLVLPAASTGLGTDWDSWGAHGIAATVVDRTDPGARLGAARSFMLWLPRDEVTPTRVSVLVPVVGSTPDPHGTGAAEDLERLTGPDGRLTALLEATADQTDVTWLLDPSLVGAADPTGSSTDDAGATDEDAGDAGTQGGDTEPDGDAGQGDETGQDDATAQDEETGDTTADQAEPAIGGATEAWVAGLLDGTLGRDVPLLPYGDADVTALAHLDEADVLALARERSREVAGSTDLPDSAPTALTLTAEDLPDLTTAAFAQTGGTHAVVVAPGEMLPPGALTYTPSGRASVSTPVGDVTVLVPDERLSTALRTGAFRVGRDAEVEGEPAGSLPTGTTPATAAQDMLAELAVITRERPSDSRHLLITVPRDWHPDPAIAAAQLRALDASPWVRQESVAALVGAPDPEVDRGTLPERVRHEGEISADELDRLEETLATRAELAELAEDPAPLLGDPEGELLAATSAAWRTDPAGRRALIGASVALTEGLRSSVQVRTGSQINLISTTGELPVVLENTLDQPVEVTVALDPQDPRLRVDNDPEVTLAARATETVHIPVHAIQSADVSIAVELRTADGVLIDDSAVMKVQVRAEWEGIGTAVLGALLAIGVVIGLIRTIRRGRTGRRSAPIDAGPDALSPEEAAG